MTQAIPTQPAWLALLADFCRVHGQRRAGTVLGYSATAINQALKGKYLNTSHIEKAVQERLQATWLGALRAECDRTTQAQAAARLGVSGTTVSQVLSGTYPAATVRIERRVRGELMAERCVCPVMGDVSTRVCQDVQERVPGKHGSGIGNPQHAQAWFACRGQGRWARQGVCPHFTPGGKQPMPTVPATPLG